MEIEEGINGEAWRWYGARILGGESILFQSTLTVEQMRTFAIGDFIRYRCMTSVNVKPSANGVEVNFGRSIIDAEQENDGLLRKDMIQRMCIPNNKLIAQVCDYWGKKAIMVAKETDLKIIR